jgi:hypothetical protein
MYSHSLRLAAALAILALLETALPSPTAAQAPAEGPSTRFLLGVDLGLSVVNPEGTGDNVTVVAWPSNVLELLPAFRFGAAFGRSEEHEIFAKTGLVYESTNGGHFSVLSLTGNYQYAFPVQGSVSPYLTAGGGLVSVSDRSSDTSALLGGGVGARFRVGDGHGALRLEGRYDHLSEGDTLDGAGVISFLFGFDLLMR